MTGTLPNRFLVKAACGCEWIESRPPGLVVDPAQPRVCSSCRPDVPAAVGTSPQGLAMVHVIYLPAPEGEETAAPDAETDEVFERAVDAAMAVLDRVLKLMAPPRWLVVEAFEAARAVYDADEDARVDDLMERTGFAGMEVHDGVRIRLKYAAEMASAMVSAFDALIETRGAENYVEWESTVTDPAAEEAMRAGKPMEEWPPHRQYRLIVVKPGGKTPHELRRQAEAERDAMLRHYSRALDELYRLRCAMVYEAAVTAAHLNLSTFPRSRRLVAREQVERMRAAARGETADAYADLDSSSAQRLLEESNAPRTLTRGQWEEAS